MRKSKQLFHACRHRKEVRKPSMRMPPWSFANLWLASARSPQRRRLFGDATKRPSPPINHEHRGVLSIATTCAPSARANRACATAVRRACTVNSEKRELMHAGPSQTDRSSAESMLEARLLLRTSENRIRCSFLWRGNFAETGPTKIQSPLPRLSRPTLPKRCPGSPEQHLCCSMCRCRADCIDGATRAAWPRQLCGTSFGTS